MQHTDITSMLYDIIRKPRVPPASGVLAEGPACSVAGCWGLGYKPQIGSSNSACVPPFEVPHLRWCFRHLAISARPPTWELLQHLSLKWGSTGIGGAAW